MCEIVVPIAGGLHRVYASRLAMTPNRFSPPVGCLPTAENVSASPFYRIISWPTNPENQRIISPSAIEASVAYIQQKKVKQFQESEDVLLEYFNAVWGTINSRRPAL